MKYLIPIILVFFNCILGAIAALLLKKGAEKKRMINWTIIKGLFLYTIGSLIFIVILKYAPVSVLYPITASTYMWSYILAKRYLKEDITRSKILGLSFILLGIIFIAVS